MINTSAFIERYYPTANEATQKDILRFFDNLAAITNGKPLTSELLNKDLLCKAFYMQEKGNAISRSHYQKIKSYLLNLFDFLDIHSVSVPTSKEVIDSQDTICYFRGLDELLDFIDNVGKTLSRDYNPNQDLIRIKGVCVLGWLGFTLNEIAMLKTNDLIPINNNGYRINNKKKSHEIYGKAFWALYHLSSLTSYRSLPSGNLVILSKDDFLFCPTTRGWGGRDEIQIARIIQPFNLLLSAENIKPSIVFRNLHKNALFLEIYNDKSDRDLLEKIASAMGCSTKNAFNYKVQYLKFADLLTQNKI